MKKRIAFSIALLLLLCLALTGCGQKDNNASAETEQTVSSAQADIKWRCAVISYDNSYVIQYKYDANGKIAEIVEFLNEGQNTDDEQSVSCTRIVFDEQGSISSVTTSVKGASTEVIDD